MRKWLGLIEKLDYFLGEQIPSGITLKEVVRIARGNGSACIDTYYLKDRENSIEDMMFRMMVEELLGYSPATEPCKEHFSKQALLLFRYGGEPRSIVDVFMERPFIYGLFEREGIAGYEKRKIWQIYASLGGLVNVGEIEALLSRWSEAWLKAYDPTDQKILIVRARTEAKK